MDLPKLILLEDYSGDFNQYLEKIYALYCSNVVDGSLYFLGKKIICQWNPPYDNKHYNFWHITTREGSTTGEENRDVDFRRCERILWVPFIINHTHTNHTDILCWENKRQGKKSEKTHTVIYLPAERYMIVLRENKYTYQLITAYPVREHQHLKLMKEQQNYLDPRKSRGRP